MISDAAAPAWAQALEDVRPDLLAIPAGMVEAPAENVAALIELAYRWVEARGGAEKEVSLARIEKLAMALARAQHGYVWQPPVAILESATSLIAAADRWFTLVEEEARTLVRRGELARRQLPRRRGPSRDDRCLYVEDLVEVLRRVPTSLSARELARAAKIARLLHGAVEVGPDYVSVVELRDRAYTALRTALDQAEAEERGAPASGVFSLDLLEPRQTASA